LKRKESFILAHGRSQGALLLCSEPLMHSPSAPLPNKIFDEELATFLRNNALLSRSREENKKKCVYVLAKLKSGFFVVYNTWNHPCTLGSLRNKKDLVWFMCLFPIIPCAKKLMGHKFAMGVLKMVCI
jgi:hypothetical protein